MLTWILFEIFLSVISQTFAKHIIESPDVLIVGGEDAPEGIAPYQVSIQQKGAGHICGGSILNERWVLTAAHCLTGTDLEVLVGTNYLSEGGQIYSPEKFVIHGNVSHKIEPIRNDIGLIKTARAIVMSERVQPIKLPKSNTEPGANLRLTGWGDTSIFQYSRTCNIDLGSTKPYQSDALQMLNLTAITRTECKNRLKGIDIGIDIIPSHLCTFTRMGEGACSGDSGGPLVEGNRLVGVVSCGIPCARGFPDIFTRVYYFLDWINNNIVET